MTDFVTQFKIALDAAEGRTELERFHSAFNRTLRELGKSDTEIKAFFDLEQAVRRGERSMAELDAETRQLLGSYQQLGQVARDRDFLGLESHKQVEAEIRKVRGAYDRLKASGQLTSAELGQAALRTRERIVELEQRTNGWGAALERSKFALGQTVAAGAGLISVVRQAATFQAAMTDVAKVVEGTPQQIEALGKEIQALSRELPISAEGLAEIAAAGGQLGIPIENLAEFTRLAAKMASAFEISTAEAGQAIGKLVNIFDLPLAKVEELGDAINTLAATTGANEPQLLEFLTRVGGTAKNFGLVAEEAAALGAALIELGKPPEVAANAVNTLLSRLQTAEVQSKEFREALAGIGIDAAEMAQRIADEPQAALLDFLGTLDKLDAKSRAQALTQLFGTEYQDDIALAVGALRKYEEALGRATDRSQTAGALNDEFTARLQDQEQQLQLLKNAISEAATNLGTVLLPAVTQITQGFTGATQGLADFVEEFPRVSALAAVVATVGVSVSGLSVLFGTLQLAGGKAISSISRNFEAAKRPVGEYAAEVGKLKTAFALLNAAIVGVEIGQYLRDEFELARIAGAFLAEALVSLGAVAKLTFDVLRNPLNADEAWVAYREEMANIRAEFAQIRQDATDAGQAALQAAEEGAEGANKQGAAAADAADKTGTLADETARVGDAAAAATPRLEAAGAAAGGLAKAGADAAKALGELDEAALASEIELASAKLRAHQAEVDALREAYPALSDATFEAVAHMVEGFAEAQAGAEAAAAQVEALREEQLRRLGLDAAAIATGISADFAQVERAVRRLAGPLEATGAELAAAIDKLLAAADSTAELEQVGALLADTQVRQSLSTADLTRLTQELTQAQGDASRATAGLEEAYRALGLTSSATLQRQAEQARAAFEAIRAANEPIADQERAWLAVAQAELRAAEAAGTVQRAGVQAALETEAAALGLGDALQGIVAGYAQAGGEAARFGEQAQSAADTAVESLLALRSELDETSEQYRALTEEIRAANLEAGRGSQRNPDGSLTLDRGPNDLVPFADGVAAEADLANMANAELLQYVQRLRSTPGFGAEGAAIRNALRAAEAELATRGPLDAATGTRGQGDGTRTAVGGTRGAAAERVVVELRLAGESFAGEYDERVAANLVDVMRRAGAVVEG